MALRAPKSATAKLHVAYLSVIVLLLFAVGWAVFEGVDAAVTLAYRDQQVYELERSHKQLASALPHIANGVDKSRVIEAFESVSGEAAHTKDGCVWVGWVGLKFSAADALEHVSPTWSYGAGDPCYPP